MISGTKMSETTLAANTTSAFQKLQVFGWLVSSGSDGAGLISSGIGPTAGSSGCAAKWFVSSVDTEAVYEEPTVRSTWSKPFTSFHVASKSVEISTG